MNLWIVLFAIGLFGLAVTSTKLAVGETHEKTPLIVIKDGSKKARFILLK